jgi:hypothetical protein
LIQRYRKHIASWQNAAMQSARPASR